MRAPKVMLPVARAAADAGETHVVYASADVEGLDFPLFQGAHACSRASRPPRVGDGAPDTGPGADVGVIWSS